MFSLIVVFVLYCYQEGLFPMQISPMAKSSVKFSTVALPLCESQQQDWQEVETKWLFLHLEALPFLYVTDQALICSEWRTRKQGHPDILWVFLLLHHEGLLVLAAAEYSLNFT